MTVTLLALTATGPDKPEARIDFRSPAMLVRGPSDTGKSYIRDCLWYLLGGDKPPKEDVPEAFGYDTLKLLVEADGNKYEFTRGAAGGDTSIAKVGLGEDGQGRETLDEDTGEFLVQLSGAQGKQLLRSKAKKGAVTGGDLRHWFLLSQPNVISEDATAGVGNNAFQRVAAFHLFLTGSDDTAFELTKSTKEVERIAGQIIGAEQSLLRVRADLPSDSSIKDVADALGRVDAALGAMTTHYDARASALKEVRAEILKVSEALHLAQSARDHSASMVERFELLDEKYKSDAERLGAVWEGVSLFQALDEKPCPLCGTPAEAQLDPRQLKAGVQDAYRRALKAELDKVGVLQRGLVSALEHEHARHVSAQESVNELAAQLGTLSARESVLLNQTRIEFSDDPKALALRRSELSNQLALYEEEARLVSEIERLGKSKKRQRVPLSRNVGDEALSVAAIAKQLLHAWGFENIATVSLDPEACDLVIDGRRRLGFGAGKRAVFLAALTIGMLKHALDKGHPHLGIVVIDSPLKAYADPKSSEQREVGASTVTDRFYAWMATWAGPGQVIILENQDIRAETAAMLDPLEFSGVQGEGRAGFYPG